MLHLNKNQRKNCMNQLFSIFKLKKIEQQFKNMF